MTYINEHILPGQIGQFFIVTAFVFALLSTFSFLLAAINKKPEWSRLGVVSFWIHSAAVMGIFGSLYWIIFNQYFEYQYVWQHSAKGMPYYYLISCLWEGQEGSFMLWIFWQVAIGLIFMHSLKNMRNGSMAVYASVQVFLTSMLLGIYVFGQKIGSTPFILIRELPEYINLPFTRMENYLTLEQFQDGRGLNPLLQNYWMVIHPPTLFLGFAAVLPPFALAIAGLFKRDFTSWIRTAIPWTFFGVMVLGTGILMGGAWAYEALSFGGFWAWDPVENAILVPWLTLVAAAHVMMIEKNRGGTLMSVYLLTFITFGLILYSTFLTRSGVLGDSSVHSFVDLGMNGQLLIYLLFYVIGSLVLLFIRKKEFPRVDEDEKLWSREFWMFIGALVLTVSSFQITFSTSIPVMNALGVVKIINPLRSLLGMEALTSLAPPIDPVSHYNAWQMPFAVLISLLIAFTQYLKYRNTDFKKFLRKISRSIILSIVLSALLAIIFEMTQWMYLVLLFTSTFAIVANTDYWLALLKGKLGISGSSIAHIGFGFILLGSLVSNAQKEVISKNDTYIAKDFPSNENILLEIGDTVKMGDYQVSWSKEELEGINRIFYVDYYKANREGVVEKAFTLTPYIQLNEKMGNVAEPSTKHFVTKDIFTHITYAEPFEVREKKKNEGFGREANVEFKKGDTAIYNQHFVLLDSLVIDQERTVYENNEPVVLAVAAHITMINVLGERFSLVPIYIIRGNTPEHVDAINEETGIKLRFEKIDTESGIVSLKAFTDISQEKDFIVMKAIIFPYINLLWLGCIIMVIGTVIALIQRIRLRS